MQSASETKAVEVLVLHSRQLRNLTALLKEQGILEYQLLASWPKSRSQVSYFAHIYSPRKGLLHIAPISDAKSKADLESLRMTHQDCELFYVTPKTIKQKLDIYKLTGFNSCLFNVIPSV